jgi:hypothetical protein
MTTPADIPAAATSAIADSGAEVTTLVIGGAVVAFGVYALKPAWRAGKAVLNKIGF